MVLATTLGFEALAAHRAWRDLADAIAAAGLPTLRFDWAGTGDSLGDDHDDDRLAAWSASLEQAIDRLEQESGVEEVAVVGLRLGATIAARVAARRADVVSFVAVGPVVAGRRHIREQRSFARMLRVRGEADPPDSDEIGGFAINGFYVSDETAAEISAIDLRKDDSVPAPRILVLAHERDATVGELVAHWRSLGAEVALEDMPEIDNLIENPTRSTTPTARWRRVVAEVEHGVAPDGDSARPAGVLPVGLQGDDWSESPFVFGREGRLFGILTRPRHSPCERPVVVLLDAGRVPHVGWGRGAVEMARRFATSGWCVLRMDPAGIGDSDAMPDGPQEVLYSREALDDVRAAMDALDAPDREGYVVIGSCSGAHLAFHAAVADPRVVGVAMINLQRFIWQTGDSLEIAMRNQMRSTSAFGRLLLRARTWKRLFTGDIHAGAVSRELMRRVVTRGGACVRRLFTTDPALDMLRSIGARGARILFVFGTEDGGRDEFATRIGGEGSLPRSVPGAELELYERTDHNFSPRDPRRSMQASLVRFLNEIRSDRRSPAAQRGSEAARGVRIDARSTYIASTEVLAATPSDVDMTATK